MNSYLQAYALNAAIAHAADLRRSLCRHGLISLFLAAHFFVGSRLATRRPGVTLGALLPELLFQPAASLRGSDGNRLLVAACAWSFQFADACCLLVRQCGVPMAGSTTLAPRHRAQPFGIRGLCSGAVPVRCGCIIEADTAACWPTGRSALYDSSESRDFKTLRISTRSSLAEHAAARDIEVLLHIFPALHGETSYKDLLHVFSLILKGHYGRVLVFRFCH